jgi:tRNA modification GTPase
MDLSQAEAVVDVIRARSERALAAANKQLRGALGQQMQGLTDLLLGLIAGIEAYIDFPEEDLPPEDRCSLAGGIEQLLKGAGRLLATSHYGEILRDGVKTVILGEPNSGKSSLLNRLVGYERALVSAEPGTTRDYLEERITLGSHCIRLTDTAGLNAHPAPLEKLGIAKTYERAAEADLILLVLDATQPAPSLPLPLSMHLTPRKTLAVINKTDLVPNGPYPVTPGSLSSVHLSALTGAGCDELVSAIIRHAETFRTEEGEDLVTINARHANALSRAIEFLQAASAKVTLPAPPELLASDLRGVLDAFSEISGRIENDEILNRLFATFCIGK